MVFPVVIHGCESWTIKKADHKAAKNWCFWTVVLSLLGLLAKIKCELWCLRRLLSPLDCQEIQPVTAKGNQSWIFIGRIDDEAETPILWLPDVNHWLIGRDPDVGQDWRPDKGTTEDKMVGYHHWCYGHEFEQAPGVGDGQGGLACCSPWGCNESDMTDRVSWTEFLS